MTERFVGPDSGAMKFEIPVRLFFLLAFAIASIVALSACGSNGGTAATTVRSVTITPTAITVPINTQTDFSAVVTLTDSTTTTTTGVTWEVNGIAGGNSTLGTIVPSTIDTLVGVYTAPAAVPTTSSGSGEQVGQVNITAVASQSTTTSTTATVTSNTAIVTVGVGLGFEITPTAAVVAAGGNEQFSAILNSVVDTGATWTVSSTGGGDIGTIDPTGLYTAPLSPPPGNAITITATDPAATAPASATITIVYSDHSLKGPYAFSYTGNDQLGFLAVAGSFVTDGNGSIISGVEDIDSFLTGVSTRVAITDSSTYVVGPDGRGTATIVTPQGTTNWAFAMTTNKHAQLTRFNNSATGGGTIDEQDLEALSNSSQAISGPYVFSASGADQNFKPMGIAGEFSADGLGDIPNTNTVLDVNDNGISGAGGIVTGDTSLQGSYQFDSLFPGTGRGTLTLTTNTSQRQFAFYAVNSTTVNVAHVVQLHLVEIDDNPSGHSLLAGDVFSGMPGNSFSASSLAAGNYVFSAGGNSTTGAYATGGVFISNGTGSITAGVLDANNAGTYNNGPSLVSCTYSVDPTTGRIDLKLFTGTGSCPSTSNSSLSEFAVYQTAQNSAVMLEIDTNAVSSGMFYQQCLSGSASCPASAPALAPGSFAVGLIGQGIFHNSPVSYQQDASGQISLNSTISATGTLDINNFSALFPSDPISISSISTPQSNGRGTVVVAATNPAATYNLIYYLIDDNTALIFDQDKTREVNGIIARQF